MFLTTPGSKAPSLSLVEGLGLLLGEFLLEDRLARQDDVVAPPVEADDLELKLFTLEGFEVLDRLDIDQGTGQERPQTNVDRQTTLDPIDDPARDDLTFLVRFFDLLPNPHALGFGLRQKDVTFLVFGLLEKNLDLIADRNIDLTRGVGELLDWDQTFGLVTDVDHHFTAGDLDYVSLNDLPLFEMTHALVVEGDKLFIIQLGVVGRGHRLRRGDRLVVLLLHD